LQLAVNPDENLDGGRLDGLNPRREVQECCPQTLGKLAELVTLAKPGWGK